jgi:RND family efflux transporter MFP subunit
LQSSDENPRARETGTTPENRMPYRSADGARTGRRLQIFAAIVAIVLVIAFLVVHHVRSRDESALAATTRELAQAPPSVVAVTVQTATVPRPLTLPGATAAWYTSTIYARVNGYVDKWYADIGDSVRKGQVLASIDTPDLDAQFVAAKAKLNAAEAEVKVKEAEAEFAKSTYERWIQSPNGVVSEQERENKKAGYNSAVAQLNAAKAQVALNQGEVDNMAAFQAYKQVTAPYDGTIIERRIDIGNLVTAGSSATTTPLYRITQDDPMRIFVDVPQSISADLMKVGVPARITSDDATQSGFEGKIARTAAAINPDSRTLRVEVDIPNPHRALVPGLYVQVTFDLETKGLIQVPAAALLFRSKGPQVAVIDGNDVVHFRPITIARDDGDVLEIASGLLPGDRVALNIGDAVTDGEKVAVARSTLDGVAASALTNAKNVVEGSRGAVSSSP